MCVCYYKCGLFYVDFYTVHNGATLIPPLTVNILSALLADCRYVALWLYCGVRRCRRRRRRRRRV